MPAPSPKRLEWPVRRQAGGHPEWIGVFPPVPALVAEVPTQLMRIDIQDALRIGEVLSLASYQLIIYLRVPPGWLGQDEQLTAVARERVLARLYGPTWRDGNEDGSQYVVMSYRCRRMTGAEEAGVDWRRTPHSWYYRVGAGEQLEQIDKEAL